MGYFHFGHFNFTCFIFIPSFFFELFYFRPCFYLTFSLMELDDMINILLEYQ